MTKPIFLIFLSLLPVFIEDVASASAVTATLMVSSKIEQCESLDDEAKCENFAAPPEEFNVPLKLIFTGEGARSWIGVISDRKEINGIKIRRGIVVFRVYSDADSAEELNTVSAWQTIEPEPENERPAAIATGIQDLNALPVTMLFNPPRKINDKFLSSQIAIFGKNATNKFNKKILSPRQHEIFNKLLRDHFEKR